MNKIVPAFVLSIATVLTATSVSAAPPQFNNDGPGRGNPHNRSYDWDQPDSDSRRVYTPRSYEDDLGSQRLKQHKWKSGYVMPQHYRGDGYKVDYKQYRLPKPDRGQQWYKINDDYILLDNNSNTIIRSLSN